MDDALGWKLRFFTIWTGQTLSLAGSALVQFALVWWLTETTGSATVLATASVAALLPGSLLGPFAGALVDRWPRRWIIVVADGAIAALTALLVILYAQGVVEVWHLYVVLALRALGTAFHDPAMTASTPLMVPKDHLTRVAGMNQTRASITNLGGPVLGALLVAYLPMHGVLAIDIATAAVAILPLLFIDIPQSLPTVTPGGQRQRSVFAETVEGFRYLWSWRGLFVVVATSSVVMFFHQPSVAFTPLMIQQHFGGGPAEWALNSAVFNAGMLAGGLLMSTWGGFKPRVINMLIGPFVMAAVCLARGVAPPNAFWLFLAAGPVFGVIVPVYIAAQRAIMQSTIPNELQGRVFAVQRSLGLSMSPLGLAVLGPVADRIGPQAIYLMTGVVVLAEGFLWLLLPSVRDIEQGPPAGRSSAQGKSP